MDKEKKYIYEGEGIKIYHYTFLDDFCVEFGNDVLYLSNEAVKSMVESLKDNVTGKCEECGGETESIDMCTECGYLFGVE